MSDQPYDRPMFMLLEEQGQMMLNFHAMHVDSENAADGIEFSTSLRDLLIRELKYKGRAQIGPEQAALTKMLEACDELVEARKVERKVGR